MNKLKEFVAKSWNRWYVWAAAITCLAVWFLCFTHDVSVAEKPFSIHEAEKLVRDAHISNRDRDALRDKLREAWKLIEQEVRLNGLAMGVFDGLLAGYLGWTIEAALVRRHDRRDTLAVEQ